MNQQRYTDLNRSKQINISEGNVLQVTEFIEGKLVNISSGVTLGDDIAEIILNMVDVGKNRTKDFRQKGLISKDIVFGASIKNSSYK